MASSVHCRRLAVLSAWLDEAIAGRVRFTRDGLADFQAQLAEAAREAERIDETVEHLARGFDYLLRVLGHDQPPAPAVGGNVLAFRARTAVPRREPPQGGAA